MNENICIQKKKFYVVGCIISIVVATITAFLFGKIGKELIGKQYENATTLNLTLLFVPILFIVILISILAVVAICDKHDKKNK